MFKNKQFFITLGLSLFMSVLFAAGASLKNGAISLDLYLGSVWVFILSMIIFLSLPNHFAKNGDKDRRSHIH